MPPVKNADCKTGVYVILNKVNGKVYVGGAYVSLEHRIRRHRNSLNGGYHFNKHLQKAWDKYGSVAFRFHVLERCCVLECEQREAHWISYLNATDPKYGYNKCLVGRSQLGVNHTEETKNKMRSAQLGKKFTDETKSKMSAANLGHKVSEATKSKIRAANTGRKMSEEQRAKLSAARLGMKFTEETKSKMRSSQRKRRERERAQSQK